MPEITAHLILEIMGRPKVHVENVLKDLVAKIESEKGLKLVKKKVHEAIELEDEKAKGLFTTFAEIEGVFNDFDTLIRIIFTYMPSNVEIIDPADFKLNCSDINLFMNEVVRKLHYYDNLAKTLTFQNNILAGKLAEKDEEIKNKKPVKEKKNNKKSKTKKKN